MSLVVVLANSSSHFFPLSPSIYQSIDPYVHLSQPNFFHPVFPYPPIFVFLVIHLPISPFSLPIFIPTLSSSLSLCPSLLSIFPFTSQSILHSIPPFIIHLTTSLSINQSISMVLFPPTIHPTIS